MKAESIVRRVPIDFFTLFKEAGIAPTRAKLGRSTVAQAWCLFIDVKDGLELHVITPPPMQTGETGLRIVGQNWCFTA